jgi:hypothetical protein
MKPLERIGPDAGPVESSCPTVSEPRTRSRNEGRADLARHAARYRRARLSSLGSAEDLLSVLGPAQASYGGTSFP